MKTMNSPFKKIGLLLLVGVGLILHSCKKDASQPDTHINSSIDDSKLIAEAKAFFDKSALAADTIKQYAITSRKTPRQRLVKAVDWIRAYTGTMSSSKMVMVPVQYDSTLTITYRGNKWKLNRITRVFIYKDKKGVMHTEVVTRIPDNYTAEASSKEKFTGLVLVEDWHGNAIKTIRFINGKTARFGNPVAIPVNSESAKDAFKYRTTGYECETYSWGHCGWNGSTGEFYGCWEDGSETTCYHVPDNDEDAGTDIDYGGGGGGGGGGVSQSTNLSNADINNSLPVIEGFAPINPDKYINCFTDGKTASQYKMTLYVDQPVQGQNDHFSFSSYGGVRYTAPNGLVFNVGHTFVGFTKINTDGTSVTQVMGFYPGGAAVKSQGIIKDDGGHGYSVSYTATVSSTQFNAALQLLSSNEKFADYVLSNRSGANEYNCTDAGISWMAQASVHLPADASRGNFTNTPGDYGQALRNFNGAQTTPGYAPGSHGPCN
jgi:hypothetical protein